MGRHKGIVKTGGRKKGVLNKNTASVRAAFETAFNNLGGSENLTDWAKKNQTEFYKLFSKLIPVEVRGDSEAPVVVEIIKYTGDDEAA